MVFACCIQSMSMPRSTCSSYFLLLLSAFYTWHKAWPISNNYIVCALIFPHEKLLLFLIIANLHIHHVTCLFNVLQFIYSSLEIIISSFLMQQNIWLWKLVHKILLSRMGCTGTYVNTASKDLGNTRSEQDSSLARIFLGWSCLGNTLPACPNISAICTISFGGCTDCELEVSEQDIVIIFLHSTHESVFGRWFLYSPSFLIAGGCPYKVRMTTPLAQQPVSDTGQLDTYKKKEKGQIQNNLSSISWYLSCGQLVIWDFLHFRTDFTKSFFIIHKIFVIHLLLQSHTGASQVQA